MAFVNNPITGHGAFKEKQVFSSNKPDQSSTSSQPSSSTNVIKADFSKGNQSTGYDSEDAWDKRVGKHKFYIIIGLIVVFALTIFVAAGVLSVSNENESRYLELQRKAEADPFSHLPGRGRSVDDVNSSTGFLSRIFCRGGATSTFCD